MSNTLDITIPVRAIPGGNSKRAFVSPKTGRAFVVDKTRGKDQFIATVRQFAAAAASDARWKITDKPVRVSIRFEFTRPKGHFGSGRNTNAIKASRITARPVGKPDLTNIVKRIEDALTGIVWRDDAQVVESWSIKLYGETDLIFITVDEIQIGPTIAQDEPETAERPNYQPTQRKPRQRKARGLNGDVKVETMAGQATFLECDE